MHHQPTDRWTSRQGQTKARTRQEQTGDNEDSALVNAVNAPTSERGFKPGPFLLCPGGQACLSPHSPPSLHSPITASSPPFRPLESPTPTISAAFYKAQHEKGAGFRCLRGEIEKRLQNRKSCCYPPPSLQESPINTHPHRDRQESGRVSSCPPPSLPTATPPQKKLGAGYLSKNRYLDRPAHRLLVT